MLNRALFSKLLKGVKKMEHGKKKKVIKKRRNIVKTSKNEKVNKEHSATWWPNFENVKKQKMDFFTILTTPENMSPQSLSV